MSLDCGSLAASIVAAECGKAPAGGTNKKVYLINYDDIDREESTIANGVISALVLKTGKVGYLFESLPKSTTGEATFARGTYINTYDHAVTLRLFIKTQAAKTFVDTLANARLVAIVENNDNTEIGETKYEVYGWDSGMTLSEMPFSTTYSDNVVYSVKLASDDSSKEGQLPASYFVTDLATTETALAALLTA